MPEGRLGRGVDVRSLVGGPTHVAMMARPGPWGRPAASRGAGAVSDQWISKTGWRSATAAHSSSVESGVTPSKNMPVSNFHLRR